MRYFAEIAYHGANYHGLQIQPNALSVQETLEDTFSKLLGEEVKLTASGRTDTGVHCRQQFVHFDVSKEVATKHFLHRINSFLPNDIAVYSLRKVKEEAHARYHALSRKYEYHITKAKNPFLQGLAHRLLYAVDVNRMNQAAQLLSQYEDYEAFCKAHSSAKHCLCQINQAFWEESDTGLVFTVRANRFLRGMVRMLTGTLLAVGQGKLTVQQFSEIIESKNNRNAGALVPAHGLYLCEVVYPDDIWLD
ncbi:tRNA pseudouridine(38-40) synthase TruA [Rapidithrix thailandica]|uniref:tRNA pseudouridine synthase A n=1 Tax=Rapidithrix thailandica TaxID=413964 RepID=A0AAW9SCQ5_9BACT